MSRTHKVALDWLFDRIDLHRQIQIKYVHTKNQFADTSTKGSFTRDEWNHLLRLLKITDFSMHVEHARVLPAHTDTRRRFEPGHGDVLNLHTERREVRGSLISLVPSLSSLLSFSPLLLLSLFRRSLPAFSFSFSSFSHSSSLSVTMTVITRPVGSLCTHSSDLP